MSVISYEEALNILAQLDYQVSTVVTSDYTTFTINNRVINIPLDALMAIQGDTNSKIIKFDFNRYFDGVDLTTKTIRVCYLNALSQRGYTAIADTILNDTTFSFLWTIPSEVSVQAGMINIQVDFYDLVDNDIIYRWQTHKASFEVIKSLEDGNNPISTDYTVQILFYNNHNNLSLIDMGSLDEPITVNGRDLIVPSSMNRNLIQQDTRSRIIPFIIPRYYDGVDLSTKTICIKFLNEQGSGDRSVITNLAVFNTTITFCWLLTDNVTSEIGNIEFGVEVIGYNELNEFYLLQTKTAQFNVIENLKVDTTIDTPQASWLQSLYIEIDNKLKALNNTVPEKNTKTIITKQFFGTHIQTPTAQWNDIGHGCIRLWDTGTNWREIEISKGVFNWTKMDSYINYAQEHGLEILYTLGQAPNFATGGIKGDGGDGTTATWSAYNDLNPNLSDWIDFITILASRYKGKIHAYELWNEPDVNFFWTGTIAQMVTLCENAYTTIRSIDSDAKILSPSFSPKELDDFLKAGGKDYFDIGTVHLYCHPDAPEAMIDKANSFKYIYAINGIDCPLWNTECGYGGYYLDYVKKEGEFRQYDLNIMPDNLSASYIARIYLANLIAGMERCFYYMADNRGNRLRLIDYLTRSTLSAGNAMKKLSDTLTGTSILDYGKSNGTYIMIAQSAEKNIAIVWNNDNETGTYKLPEIARVMNVETILGVKSYPMFGIIQTSQMPVIIHDTKNNVPIPIFTIPNDISTPVSGNLIVNGDFSNGLSNWEIDNINNAIWDFSNGYAKCTLNGQTSQIRQRVDVQPNTKYKLSYKFDGLSDYSNEGNVNIHEFNSSYGYIDGHYAIMRSGFIFLTSPTTSYILLDLGSDGATSGMFAIANVVLQEVQ